MFEGHPLRDAPARKLPSALIQPRSSRWVTFAAVFNSTVAILAHVEQPALGEPFELHWRPTGKASHVQRLQTSR